jgi:hypothetical protein
MFFELEFCWYWFVIGIAEFLKNQPIPIQSQLLVLFFNTIKYNTYCSSLEKVQKNKINFPILKLITFGLQFPNLNMFQPEDFFSSSIFPDIGSL